MTIVEAPNLYEVVTPPSFVPYRFGLFSVLDFTSDGRGLGMTWESDACYVADYTTDRCLDVETTALTPTSCEESPEFDPFTVYVLAEDSIAGNAEDTWSARAVDRLAAGEQKGAEAAMHDRLTAAVPAPADAPSAADPIAAAVLALALVEQQLAETSGTEGVIFMDRWTATLLNDNLTVQGGTLRTLLGTRVAALGVDMEDVIYGTGPLKGVRGDVEVSSGSPATTINDISVLAQRTYNIGWDCSAVGYTAVTA